MSKADNQNEEYKTLSVREQIRLRPGMWIGSKSPQLKELPVYDEGGFVNKEIEVIPAISKIIEEALANSIDEHTRTKADKKLRGWVVDRIDVQLTANGLFKIRDNGGVDTGFHSTGPRIVEVIFGKLFSSSNYDDTENRTTVGTNGVGVKALNCMSTAFTVETADSKNALQIDWSDGMQNPTEKYFKKSKEHFTEITSQIELEKFDVEEIPYGTLKYIERTCILAAAANPGLTIAFNDEEFKFDSFKEYVQLYGYKELIGAKNENWEYWIAPVPLGQGGEHYGLVNGVACDKGTVAKMLDGWLWESIRDYTKSKGFKKEHGENIDPTPNTMSSCYVMFSNTSIINPEYSSQAKEELTTDATVIRDGKKRWRKFTSQDEISESSIIDSIVDWYTQKKNAEEAGAVRKKTRELKSTSAKSIRKLIDATGSKKSERQAAELWIFEGASAGSAFRPARNPKVQGALFLKGKCQNSFGMSTLKLINNEEFQNIIVSLGLDPSNPESLKNLRYGNIVVATDMDTDGDSIFGQLATMFVMHFPETVKAGMLKRAISPLYAVTKGKEKKYFYTQEEYDKFKGTGWKSKYFKGLGSLTKEDYKEMLANPKFEEYHIDNESHKYISDWMGGSSAAKKRYLEQR